MRFGVCTGIENIKKLEFAGFDYIECRVSTVAGLSKQQYEDMKKVSAASPVKCESFNFFFPEDMRLVGPEINEQGIAAYAEKAITRTAALGAKNFVVGSGKARMVPAGWSKEKAAQQFADALKIVGQISAKYKIDVVIEAIRSESTNLINNLKEAVEVMKMVREPNVCIMADYSQMSADNESMDEIVKYGRYIKHLHIIDLKTRYFPLDRNDSELKEFFSAVKKTGYDGRLSIELSRFESQEDARRSLEVIKEMSR